MSDESKNDAGSAPANVAIEPTAPIAIAPSEASTATPAEPPQLPVDEQKALHPDLLDLLKPEAAEEKAPDASPSAEEIQSEETEGEPAPVPAIPPDTLVKVRITHGTYQHDRLLKTGECAVVEHAEAKRIVALKVAELVES